MCILCSIQKWSRRVATMLPWLVIPLIGLSALSQLLPPALRFEITSPRLACVFVLLVTLFWYEVLMPWLSAWRVRRNARLKEKARLEAIEFDKLRKNATRRCRNCLTPYRDQNPGGGRFMCSYCGHVSKRPVLDVPFPSGMRVTHAVALKDAISKAGRAQNWKTWPGRGWMCRHDWLNNDNCYAGKSTRLKRNVDAFFTVNSLCFAEKSCSGVRIFFCKLVMWLWRKIFRRRASGEDDASHTEISAKISENGCNLHESKVEKARRKAEEKRQARLERELLEEEERKQREEVARLIEERRKQRDVNVKVAESGRDRVKVSVYGKDRNMKKEAEKKRQEKRKDKDKESSKSSSDVEELERRVVKNGDRKGGLDKADGIARPGETVKAHHLEAGHGLKNDTVSGFKKGNYGRRYLDRMRGTFFSPTKAFTGGSFFMKGGNGTVATKENKSGVKNLAHASVNRRDLCPPERAGSAEGADTNESFHNPVLTQPHPVPAPKKSWQQLFARAPVVPTPSNISVITGPQGKIQLEGQTSFPATPISNLISFQPSSPFRQPDFAKGSSVPRVVESPRIFLPEKKDIFEDPCYDADPMSLIEPVSESLLGFERHHSVCKDAIKPSPIESPISRLRGVQPEALHGPSRDGSEGIWQMWNTTPLGQDSLSFAGGASGWLEPFKKANHVADGARSPAKGECNGSAYNDKWLHDAFFPPLPGNEQSLSSQVDSTYPQSVVNCWPKKEWSLEGLGENGATSTSSSFRGSSPSVPDENPVWSYHHRF